MRSYVRFVIPILLSACTTFDVVATDTSTIGTPPTPAVCAPGTPDNLALFGDGHDGDIVVPPAASLFPPSTVLTLTRDVFWRNVTFPDGAGSIDTNGWTVHISGTLTGPPDNGFFAWFHHDGRSALGATPGMGYPAGVGTAGIGGSGTGGQPNISDVGTPPSGAFWVAAVHPGPGGSGGGAGSLLDIPGSALPVSQFAIMTDDATSGAAMTLFDGRPVGGGAGGAGGRGISGAVGGGGGAGGGNVVVIASQIVNPGRVLISARGGNGGRVTTGTAGGGGGGSGGYVTVITRQGSPYPIVDVSGGQGGGGHQVTGTTAKNGGFGANGAVLPFCVGSGPMVMEIFGTGSDGDFTVPPGTTVVLDRDMYWRNLTFPDVTSSIDPNGFVIHVSGTLLAPAPDLVFAGIGRDGENANGSTPGAGYPCNGTLDGGSGSGGTPNSTAGGNAIFPTTSGFTNVWPDTWHPGAGGAGGNGTGFPTLGGGGNGGFATVAPPESGGIDLFESIRLRLTGDDGSGNFGSPFMGGGGGGAGGPGAGGTLGGAGGAGGGNVVVIAKEIVNPTKLVISSRGGKGGFENNGVGGGGGGGGGGGAGGFIVIVTYRRTVGINFAINGGVGRNSLSGGSPGTDGAPGLVIPFSFVTNS